MTYNVFGGTLNLALSIFILYLVLCVIKAVKNRHDIKVCAVFCRVSSCFVLL